MPTKHTITSITYFYRSLKVKHPISANLSSKYRKLQLETVHAVNHIYVSLSFSGFICKCQSRTFYYYCDIVYCFAIPVICRCSTDICNIAIFMHNVTSVCILAYNYLDSTNNEMHLTMPQIA